MLECRQMSQTTSVRPSGRRGPRALRIWMADREVSVKELAAALGCSEMYVTRLRKGTSKPNLAHGLELERITDGAVSAGSWKETA